MISRHAVLYTEMVTTGAILHGDAERHLAHDAAEYPLVLQLGGSEPAELAACAKLAEQWGYSAVNINVGCPSDRVQRGRFGACLMAEPDTVADCWRAMREAVEIPVTVKCRVGIDRDDSYAPFEAFVGAVADAGCTHFDVHARKAWLDGLSPADNRDIPPLRYEWVHRLKAERPELDLVLNGGLSEWSMVEPHLDGRAGCALDGVMIGRAAYHNPWLFSEVDRRFFGAAGDPTRDQVIADWRDYVGRRLEEGVPLTRMTRHMLGLFNGLPGARKFRRVLSENAYKRGAGIEVLDRALHEVRWPLRV